MLSGPCLAHNDKSFLPLGHSLWVERSNKAGLFTMPHKSSTYVYTNPRNQRNPSCSYFVHQTYMLLVTTEVNNPKPRRQTIRSCLEMQWTYNKGKLHKAFVHWSIHFTSIHHHTCHLIQELRPIKELTISRHEGDAMMLMPRESRHWMMMSWKILIY